MWKCCYDTSHHLELLVSLINVEQDAVKEIVLWNYNRSLQVRLFFKHAVSNPNTKKGFLHRDIFYNTMQCLEKWRSLRFLSYRNLSVDLHQKSFGWFCCGRNIRGHNLWLNEQILNQLTKLPVCFDLNLFFLWIFFTIGMILSSVCISFHCACLIGSESERSMHLGLYISSNRLS